MRQALLRCRNLERADLIQRDGRHAFLDPAPFEELLAYVFVLHDDIVKLASCHDLERRAFPVGLGLEREERRDEALDLPRVESGRGV